MFFLISNNNHQTSIFTDRSIWSRRCCYRSLLIKIIYNKIALIKKKKSQISEYLKSLITQHNQTCHPIKENNSKEQHDNN